MMVLQKSAPRDIFLGELRREYTYQAGKDWRLDSPGGNAIYAAVGYLIWEKEFNPGLCTRVGEDFPQAWLDDFSSAGINLDGVVVLPRALDLRSCFLVQGESAREIFDPTQHVNGFDEGLPTGLIGYHGDDSKSPGRMSSKPTAVREADLPLSYQSATSAHLCPLDYLSHNLLPAVLRKGGFSTITIQPCADYMDPAFFSDIPSLITGLTAFIPSEDDLLNLYRGKSMDLWAIAEDLGRHGCEMIVIQRGIAGSSLYESGSGRRIHIEAYPARLENPVGAAEAFCGGFLAGLRQTQDPVQAALYGNVAYSLMIEGSGPFYPLKAIPGLASARLDYLRSRVREI